VGKRSRENVALVVFFLSLAFCAYLLAGLICDLLRLRFASFPRGTLSSVALNSGGAKVAETVVKDEDIVPLFRKSISSSPAGTPSVSGRGRTVALGMPPSLPPPAVPPMTLLGTLIVHGEASALIEAGGEQVLVTRGGKVGGMEVLEIQAKSVVLGGEGRRVTLYLASAGGEEEGSPPSGQPVTLPNPGPFGSPASCERAVLDRAEFKGMLESPERGARGVKFTTVVRGGSPYGVLINYVTPDNIFNRIGVRPGDLLKTINGSPLRTPEEAFQAYQVLKNEDHFSLEIERNGVPMHIEVELR